MSDWSKSESTPRHVSHANYAVGFFCGAKSGKVSRASSRIDGSKTLARRPKGEWIHTTAPTSRMAWARHDRLLASRYYDVPASASTRAFPTPLFFLPTATSRDPRRRKRSGRETHRFERQSDATRRLINDVINEANRLICRTSLATTDPSTNGKSILALLKFVFEGSGSRERVSEHEQMQTNFPQIATRHSKQIAT